MFRFPAFLSSAVIVVALAAQPLRAEVALVMAELPGCAWCMRWNAEIAPVYPKTAEGAAAPLRRVDMRDLPGDLTLLRPVRAAPTFLLVRDGAELGRIEGYPGEAFFWGLLGQLLNGLEDEVSAPQG